MKLTHADLVQRIRTEDVRQYDILGYGIDNLYPQFVKTVVEASGQASSCVANYAEYIEGNGFVDETFYKSVVNNAGETMDYLLNKIAEDKAAHAGEALLIKYNPFGEPVELYHIPFEYVRIGINDHAGMLGVYDNWDRLKKSRIYKAEIQWYNQYDPSKAITEIDSIGFENYGGQLYYCTKSGMNAYGLAPIDPELESCISDAQIKMSHFGSLITGFMDTTLITLEQTLEEDNRGKFVETLESFQGGDNSGQLLVLDGIAKDDITVSNLNSSKSETALEKVEISIRERIRKVFKTPPILLGDQTATGFADQGNFLMQSKLYYSEITNKDRRSVETTMEDIFTDWAFVVNPSGNYSIAPIAEQP